VRVCARVRGARRAHVRVGSVRTERVLSTLPRGAVAEAFGRRAAAAADERLVALQGEHMAEMEAVLKQQHEQSRARADLAAEIQRESDKLFRVTKLSQSAYRPSLIALSSSPSAHRPNPIRHPPPKSGTGTYATHTWNRGWDRGWNLYHPYLDSPSMAADVSY
jgi:hypothetical protein